MQNYLFFEIINSEHINSLTVVLNSFFFSFTDYSPFYTLYYLLSLSLLDLIS